MRGAGSLHGLARAFQQRLDGRPCIGRGHDRHDLELDEIAPEGHPLLEQARILALHELKAAVEVGFDPAAHVAEPFRSAATALAKAPVHRLRVPVLEPLDHHEEHRAPPSATTAAAASTAGCPPESSGAARFYLDRLSAHDVISCRVNILEFSAVVWLGSIVAGFLGALTGLGGGIVVIPMLTLLFGVDIRYAAGAALISVIATSSGAASAYVRDGYSNLRVGMFLELATTFGAVVGASLAAYISGSSIAVIFGVVLLASAYLSLRSGPEQCRGAT